MTQAERDQLQRDRDQLVDAMLDVLRTELPVVHWYATPTGVLCKLPRFLKAQPGHLESIGQVWHLFGQDVGPTVTTMQAVVDWMRNQLVGRP